MADPDPTPSPRRSNLVQAAEAAAAAVSFERLLITGLLLVLVLILALSFALARTPAGQDSKAAEFTLSFFKDLALMMSGALGACLSRHAKDKSDA